MALIRLWLSRAWGYIAAGVAVVLGLLAIRQSGKDAARTEDAAKINREAQKAREKAREVDEEINQLDDAAVRDRASQWVRGTKSRH